MADAVSHNLGAHLAPPPRIGGYSKAMLQFREPYPTDIWGNRMTDCSGTVRPWSATVPGPRHLWTMYKSYSGS